MGTAPHSRGGEAEACTAHAQAVGAEAPSGAGGHLQCCPAPGSAHSHSCDPPVGRNEKGQLGHGDTKRVEAPRLIDGLSHEVIVLAACGRNHTLALTGKEWQSLGV